MKNIFIQIDIEFTTSENNLKTDIAIALDDKKILHHLENVTIDKKGPVFQQHMAEIATMIEIAIQKAEPPKIETPQ